MMALSWLSQQAVRYEVLGLGVQLEGGDLFQGVLLLVFVTHAPINH